MSMQPYAATPAPILSERPSAPASLVEWASAAQAAHSLAEPLCRTDFVPAIFKGNPAAATAAILYGAEAGLSPLQALQGIYVIGGRPALYSRTMLALTLAAGHEINTVESTDARAVVEARRRGSSHVEKVVVTIDQAKRAGWTKNAKYGTEPATMLLARAQSQACRRVAPDALLGMAYSAEELQDETPDAPEPKRTARRKAPVERTTSDEPSIEPEMAPDDDLITDAQSRKLHALLREQGLDRDASLALIGDVIGREVDTSKTLTKAEASVVIDRLDLEPPPSEPAEPDWPAVTPPGPEQ